MSSPGLNTKPLFESHSSTWQLGAPSQLPASLSLHTLSYKTSLVLPEDQWEDTCVTMNGMPIKGRQGSEMGDKEASVALEVGKDQPRPCGLRMSALRERSSPVPDHGGLVHAHCRASLCLALQEALFVFRGAGRRRGLLSGQTWMQNSADKRQGLTGCSWRKIQENAVSRLNK